MKAFSASLVLVTLVQAKGGVEKHPIREEIVDEIK